MTKLLTYSELSRLETFEERYDYLRISGSVGAATFGFDRYLNQRFYRSQAWKDARDFVIIRDNGCDLGDPDREIHSKILIHHMNPISPEDLEDFNQAILDPEFLITTCHDTLNAIHSCDASLLISLPKERRPGDTVPWR